MLSKEEKDEMRNYKYHVDFGTSQDKEQKKAGVKV